jgi:hypothetical protein
MASGLDRMTRALGPAALTIAVAVGALAPGAAAARGYFSFGLGFYPPPPPVVYAPPPVYYVPPPPVAYPPPPYYAAPTTYAPVAAPPATYAPPAAAPAAQECREYQSTAVIDGQPQQTVGTACRQPDGTWRIVK